MLGRPGIPTRRWHRRLCLPKRFLHERLSCWRSMHTRARFCMRRAPWFPTHSSLRSQTVWGDSTSLRFLQVRIASE